MMATLAEVTEAFPWFFPTVLFLFGACIGSFLNVVIYRLPAGKSVVTPGSHCQCGQPVRWHDNIPVLSWLILRGRARCCGAAFSVRYPFVELLTGLLFLACWLAFPPAKALVGCFFVSLLVAATFIDLDHFIIPDVFTIGGAVAGVILAVFVPSLHDQADGLYLLDGFRSGATALTGLLIGSALVLWIALLAEVALKKEAMGFGDVKFVGMIGAFCGWQGGVFALFGGAVVGTVWIGLSLLWQKLTGKAAPVAPKSATPEGEDAPIGFGVHVPFGPMLAVAGAVYFLWAHRWVDAWFADIAELL